jgi:hypothetical protein
VLPVPRDIVWESDVVNIVSHQQRMHSNEQLQSAAATAVSVACLLTYAKGQVTELALRRDLGVKSFPGYRGVWHDDSPGHCVLVFACFETGMQSSGSAESRSTRYAWWLGHNIVQSACMVCMIARSQFASSVLERMHWCLCVVQHSGALCWQLPGHSWVAWVVGVPEH